MSDIAHQVTVSSGQSWFSHAAYVLRENPITALAFGLFFLLLVLALFGSALAPYDPLASNAAQALMPPSAAHWFGTDHLGRDVFSRVLVATRLDLMISVAAVALSFVPVSARQPVTGAAGLMWSVVV